MGNNPKALQLVDGEQRVIHPYRGLPLSNKEDKLLPDTTTWMDLRCMCSKQPNSKGFCLWHSSKGRTTGTENISVVSRDWGLRRIWLQRAGGYPWADGSLLYFDHNSMHFSKLTESYTRKVQFYCLQIPSNKKNLHEPEEGPWGLASSAQLPQTLSQAPLFSHFCRVPPSAEGRRERLGRQSWAPPLGRGGSSTAAAPAVWLHHPCWFPCKWYLH